MCAFQSALLSSTIAESPWSNIFFGIQASKVIGICLLPLYGTVKGNTIETNPLQTTGPRGLQALLHFLHPVHGGAEWVRAWEPEISRAARRMKPPVTAADADDFNGHATSKA